MLLLMTQLEKQKWEHMGAYILPIEIFHCMYIGTAVDLMNGKEYINYGTCMWHVKELSIMYVHFVISWRGHV